MREGGGGGGASFGAAVELADHGSGRAADALVPDRAGVPAVRARRDGSAEAGTGARARVRGSRNRGGGLGNSGGPVRRVRGRDSGAARDRERDVGRWLRRVVLHLRAVRGGRGCRDHALRRVAALSTCCIGPIRIFEAALCAAVARIRSLAPAASSPLSLTTTGNDECCVAAHSFSSLLPRLPRSPRSRWDGRFTPGGRRITT